MTDLTAPVSIFLPALEGGGAERAMLHLARGLADRGYTVHLVLAEAEGAYLDQVPSNIQIVDLQSRTPVLLTKTLALQRYLQEERPAALFSALDIASSATWAKRLAGSPTPVIMCVQTHLSNQFRDHQPHTLGRVRPLLVRWFYPMADRLVAASLGTAADVSQISGIPLEQIEVIYNPVVTPEVTELATAPVDHPWFASGEPPVILGVGRLVSQKDFPTLIRAFAHVREQLAARLVILGEGQDRPQLEHLIRDLGLEAEVSLPGFTANPYAYMARASVFALSSIFEGFGNVVAEALAVGTAVVSTDCPSGPSEILEDGRYGKLVPTSDPIALADALVATLQAPPQPEVLRQRAQAFTIATVTQQYIAVLEQLLQQRTRSVA